MKIEAISDQIKRSSKVLCKKALHYPLDTYKQVLDSNITARGYKTGIKLHENMLVICRQYRASRYFLYQQTVKSDSITTKPLLVVLWPHHDPAPKVCDVVGGHTHSTRGEISKLGGEAI